MHLRSLKKYSNEIYLQDPIGVDKEGNEVTVEERLSDESYSIDDQVNLKMQIISLYNILNTVLTDREKRIIELRYGITLDDTAPSTGDEVTQREIARELNISRSYVSRIEKKVLSKLNKELERIQ